MAGASRYEGRDLMSVDGDFGGGRSGAGFPGSGGFGVGNGGGERGHGDGDGERDGDAAANVGLLHLPAGSERKQRLSPDVPSG